MDGLSVAVPQLPVTVIVCPVTVAKFVYISFNLSADSLQFATEKVNLIPVADIFVRLMLALNTVDKFNEDDIADQLNAGTALRDEQL